MLVINDLYNFLKKKYLKLIIRSKLVVDLNLKNILNLSTMINEFKCTCVH